jgi:hypothetical protein
MRGRIEGTSPDLSSPQESDRRIEAGQRCKAEQIEPICTDFTGDFEDLGIYLVPKLDLIKELENFKNWI